MRVLMIMVGLSLLPPFLFGMFHLAKLVANGGTGDSADVYLLAAEAVISLILGTIGWWLWKTRLGRRREDSR